MIYTMLIYLCHLLHIFILLSSGTNIENKTDRRMLRRKNKIDIVEYTEDFYSVRNVVLGTKLHQMLLVSINKTSDSLKKVGKSKDFRTK